MNNNVSLANLSDGFGAEIRGVDLSTASERDTLNFVQLLSERKILVFPDQSMYPVDLLNFSKLFGIPIIHRLSKFHHHDFPEILILSNEYCGDEPKGVHGGAAYWHSDNSYEPVEFARATLLYCVSASKEGGDTEFADLTAAYEAWPESGRACLDSLQVMHSFGNRATSDGCLAAPKLDNQPLSCFHPLVITHPRSNRRSFYAVGGSARGINGYSEADGVALLDQVLAHSTQRDYCLSHKYKRGDLVVFDNLSTLHRGTIVDRASGPDDVRLLHRVSVM